MILPVMIGKLSAGVIAIVIATYLSVPKAIILENEQLNVVEAACSEEKR